MRVFALALLGLFLQEGLEARRDAASARIEALRGLSFKTPLGIREGTRREYAAFALENARRVYGPDLAAAEKALKSLGLISPLMRLELALTAYAGIGVKIFCSRGEILLLDPAAGEDLLVNKMTLGLVDQHYTLRGPATYDAQMALAALRMGDAELTKHLFWHGGKLPDGLAPKLAEEADAWERGGSRLASAVVSRIFVRTADFSWRRGGAFAAAVHAEGGLPRLNRAYAEPPLSTEQILHPDKYLAGEAPAAIDLGALDHFLASRGYRALYRTVLGELGTALVLETHFPREDLAAASRGWNGDTLALYEKEGEAPLAAWATDWDTEKDAAEFSGPATRLAPVLSGAVFRRKTAVALLLNVPEGLDGLEETLWKCSRRRKDQTEAYGE